MTRRKKTACKTKVYAVVDSRLKCGDPIRGETIRDAAVEVARHLNLTDEDVRIVVQTMTAMEEDGYIKLQNGFVEPLPVSASGKPIKQASGAGKQNRSVNGRPAPIRMLGRLINV